MKFIVKWAWIGAVLFGVGLLAGGVYMITEAFAAKDEIRTALVNERIITAEDAEIPLVPVDSAAAAKAQADAIQKHTLAITEGKTYAELDRNDPRRATYLQAVTLRTALMESYLAFKVSDLVAGVGVIVSFLGASQIALGLYLGIVFGPERAREQVARSKTALNGI